MINKLKILALFLLLIFFIFNLIDVLASQKEKGDRIEKYDNGVIKSKIYYEKDLKNGKALWYYKSGKLEVKSYYENNKQVGETIFYYEDGSLKTYYFFNSKGKLIYGKKYDKEGRLISETGKPSFLVFNKTGNNVEVGEEVGIFIYSATPPNCKVKIASGEIRNDSFIIQNSYIRRNKNPYFKYIFNEIGEKKIVLTIAIIDTILNYTYEDTTYVKIDIEG